MYPFAGLIEYKMWTRERERPGHIEAGGWRSHPTPSHTFSSHFVLSHVFCIWFRKKYLHRFESGVGIIYGLGVLLDFVCLLIVNVCMIFVVLILRTPCFSRVPEIRQLSEQLCWRMCGTHFHQYLAKHIFACDIAAAVAGTHTPCVVVPVIAFDKLGIASRKQFSHKTRIAGKFQINKFAHDVEFNSIPIMACLRQMAGFLSFDCFQLGEVMEKEFII